MGGPPPPLSPIPEDGCPTTPSKSPSRTSITTMANGTHNNNNIGSLISDRLDLMPKSIQFITLALCVFFFFGIHNVLQEAMVNTEGFTFGVMLGWMEVLGVTLFSGIERSSLPFIGNGEGRRKRMAPWQAYPPLTFCLLMSSSLASWSLNYINFPTKVVFRSCKLLPTMAMAYIMGNAKRFTYIEVGSAMAICAGLITFAAGDWSLSKPQFHPFGLTLVTLSVFADAVLPNAQEKLFRTYDASKSEVMFFTNIYTLVVQSISAFFSGDMLGMFHFVMGQSGEKVNYFASFMMVNVEESDGMSAINSTDAIQLQEDNMLEEVDNNDEEIASSTGQIRHTFIVYMLAYILISHIAVSAHTAVVKKFGGVAAVFVGTARKGMTLILSFVLFPKESNWKYAVGVILVLGGLTIAGMEKQRNKRNNNNNSISSNINNDDNVAKRKNSGESIDVKLQVPALPLVQSNGNGTDGGDSQDSESQPLMHDVEIGRAPSSANGVPERRR